MFFFLLIAISSAIVILGIDSFLITNTRWLHNAESDTASSYNGWYFFKNDFWRFPLGSNPNYGDTFGNSIVFSDSIPILALFFKFISPVMPENFHYFSIWYSICFFLQLYFSYKILIKFTKNNFFSFIGSLFFLIAPILIYRVGLHPALAGQWILLFTLYLGLTKTYQKSKLMWIFVIAISSLIHFYFTIIISISFAIFRISNFFIYKESFFQFVKDFFITFITLLLTMYVIGYFEVRVVDALGPGYGELKLNLLSIFDPFISEKQIAWSWILPDIKVTAFESAEGFNYLGLGQILMISISLILFVKKKSNKNLIFFKKNKEIKIFIWISLILTLLALSNKISFGSYTLIEIPLNKFIYGSLSLFRASGRAFWIVNYFLVLLSLIIIFKTLYVKRSLFLIIILLIIQIADTSAGLKRYIKLNTITENIYIPSDPIWENVLEKHKIVKTTYPDSYSQKFTLFSSLYEKYSIKKTNLIRTARANRKLIAEARYDLYKKFRDKKLDSNTLYVIDNLGHLRNLKQIFKNDDVGFFFRDKIWIMLKNEKKLMNSSDVENFNKIKPKLLETNKINEIYFKNWENYYGFGWSHNSDKQGIWSDGKLATLLFSVEQDTDDMILEIDCKPYLTNKNKNLDIDIYVNNKFNQNLKFEYINNSEDKKIRILLDEKLNKDKEIKIDFNINNPVSPLEVLKNPDSRKLGILIKSIQLI